MRGGGRRGRPGDGRLVDGRPVRLQLRGERPADGRPEGPAGDARRRRRRRLLPHPGRGRPGAHRPVPGGRGQRVPGRGGARAGARRCLRRRRGRSGRRARARRLRRSGRSLPRTGLPVRRRLPAVPAVHGRRRVPAVRRVPTVPVARAPAAAVLAVRRVPAVLAVPGVL